MTSGPETARDRRHELTRRSSIGRSPFGDGAATAGCRNRVATMRLMFCTNAVSRHCSNTCEGLNIKQFGLSCASAINALLDA
jgi:hypothetical protein